MRPTPEPGTPSDTEFLPSTNSCQKASKSSAPGNRHAMPTIAIGSPPRRTSRSPTVGWEAHCVEELAIFWGDMREAKSFFVFVEAANSRRKQFNCRDRSNAARRLLGQRCFHLHWILQRMDARGGLHANPPPLPRRTPIRRRSNPVANATGFAHRPRSRKRRNRTRTWQPRAWQKERRRIVAGPEWGRSERQPPRHCFSFVGAAPILERTKACMLCYEQKNKKGLLSGISSLSCLSSRRPGSRADGAGPAAAPSPGHRRT